VLGTQASRPQPTAVDACRQVVATQRLPLEAAADALGQWEVHVGAMNKLVTGAITLDQATAFWNQTRVGAARRVHTFLDAAAAYREGTQGSCPSPEGVPASASALHACADTVVARNKAISAAETAATTWNGHVRDMEMLRMGHLSPAKATQMWLASWRAGVRQLDAYAVATHKAHAHHC
jgi:hypothetical protein